MHAHVFQHVPFEGPATIGPWLRHAGFQISTTSFFEHPSLPDPASIDFLLVLGGPMSVHDTSLFPWLTAETDFIRRVLDAGKPLLGICLGAQLLARALGARVFPHRHKEIGWFPVEGLLHGDSRAFRFPPVTDAFHWHGETFDLPPRAVHLARSAACEHQAFQAGRAIGLQFHLETTPESVQALIDHARADLAPGPFVQSESDLLSAPPTRFESLHRLLDLLLRHLLEPVSLPRP